jgi:DNA-binding transcriptional MerR regulator
VEEPWTILELAELAADALAAPGPAGASAGAGAGAPAGAAIPVRAERSGPARTNGRVRDVPNERLVRWYVTVGLVDPPLSRRGRVARYGRRHLLQLVAVKRRQAEGRSLAEIQAELAGATDEKLGAVARLPHTRPAPEAPAATPGRFWARRPGQTEPVQTEPVQTEPVQTEPVTAERGGVIPAGGLVPGVRLAPGVTLLLEDAGRGPGPEDVTEILNAAQPLLAELARRRLRAERPE